MEIILTDGNESVTVKDDIVYSRQLEQMARRLFDDMRCGIPMWNEAEKMKAEKYIREPLRDERI